MISLHKDLICLYSEVSEALLYFLLETENYLMPFCVVFNYFFAFSIRFLLVALVYNVFYSFLNQMLNRNEWNQSNTSGRCNSPSENNRLNTAQHFAPGSVKSSPSNSSTSGDTDSNLIFPCPECGK